MADLINREIAQRLSEMVKLSEKEDKERAISLVKGFLDDYSDFIVEAVEVMKEGNIKKQIRIIEELKEKFAELDCEIQEVDGLEDNNPASLQYPMQWVLFVDKSNPKISTPTKSAILEYFHELAALYMMQSMVDQLGSSFNLSNPEAVQELKDKMTFQGKSRNYSGAHLVDAIIRYMIVN